MTRRKNKTVYKPPNFYCRDLKFLEGVDKVDMLLALWKTKCKTLTRYNRIAFHLFFLGVVNVWTIYREIDRNGALLPSLQEYVSA